MDFTLYGYLVKIECYKIEYFIFIIGFKINNSLNVFNYIFCNFFYADIVSLVFILSSIILILLFKKF